MNCRIDARYVSRKRSGTTISPSGRAVLIVARARSRSLGPRTSTGWSFRPSASAAGCTAFQAIVVNGLAGLSRATTRDLRDRLLEKFEPLSLQRRRDVDSPVTLPPGCARLDTRPAATGSPAIAVTIGIDWSLAWPQSPGCRGDDESGLRRTSSAARTADVPASLGPLVPDDELLTLHVVELTKALTKGVAGGGGHGEGCPQKPDRRSWPAAARRRRAARPGGRQTSR